MTVAIARAADVHDSLEAAIAGACRAIAPSWPLDQQIAFNPYWGFLDRPFRLAADELTRVAGCRFALPPADYRHAWQSGEITRNALRQAIAESATPVTLDAALSALDRATSAPDGLPLPSDVADRHASSGDGPSWREVVTQQVSQYCASYFDDHQSDWSRGRQAGLYAGWRLALLGDHALVPLKQASRLRDRAGDLPDSATDAIRWAVDRLGLEADEQADFLLACLMRINGWAAWCAWLGWQADLRGGTDPHLRELLAIRACWEALLDEDAWRNPGQPGPWRQRWAQARQAPRPAAVNRDALWQRAHELSYQQRLVAQLARHATQPVAAPADTRARVQLVFCIDVRSERFRRALEACDARIETAGFAGFFGLPIHYRSLGVAKGRLQLPGLLAPSLEAVESTGRCADDEALTVRRRQALDGQRPMQAFQRSPSGAFAMVESVGLGYAMALLRRHFGAASASVDDIGLSAHDRRALRPQLQLPDGEATQRKTALLAAILRTLGLTSGFARLLVLVGHGSHSANNPQAAALDCGACGGHAGDVNARLLAGLLNDDAVRAGLRDHGIVIPADTVAIGALHDTTTDEVTLFDTAEVPASHGPDIGQLRRDLEAAGQRTRAERAADLGLGGLAGRPAALLKRLRRRTTDWAETRPEWGLANNAAFIVAPRARTRGLDLGGRCFLHDYSARHDADGAVLESIMTAPMVVAHCINLQYFASTVDPDRFGSGNKVLHNVACGRIGVFEGNTGDLRIGLSRQSVHDGRRWMHAPLRLSVVIDAPRERIDAIVARHAIVRQLVDNQWLYLFRFADDHIEWRDAGRWRRRDILPDAC